MTQDTKIIPLKPRQQATCTHVWTQGEETGTSWQYRCRTCGAYGYRGSYTRGRIKPYKNQAQAKVYVRECAHRGEAYPIGPQGRHDTGELDADEIRDCWAELAEGGEEWVDPEPYPD